MRAGVMLIALWLAAASALPAAAQLPGDRVRVTAPSVLSAPAAGRLAAIDTVALRLEVERSVMLTIPVDAIAGLELSKGQPYLRNAAAGAVGGLVLGVVIGAVTLSQEAGGGDPLGELATGLAGGFAGGVLGIPIGAFVGALVTREGWRALRVERGSAGAAPNARADLDVLPGERLRVTPSGGSRFVGRSVAADSALRLEVDRAIRAVDWGDVQRLETRGRNRRFGAIAGGILLGGATLVAGGIDYGQEEVSASEWLGAVALNSVLGAGIGYLIAPPGWVDVPTPRPARE